MLLREQIARLEAPPPVQVFATDIDEHALEVALSRLRQTLGVPGLIATVVKRGYRIDV
jgi:DNA-binding response OmpR family regulator